MEKRTLSIYDVRSIYVLKYLQNYKIIGEDKAISGEKLVEELIRTYPRYFDETFSKTDLRRCILKLRRNEVKGINVIRQIGSSNKGYFLVKKGENGLEYQKNFALSVMKTAIKAGVPKDIFYKELANLDNKEVIDNQTRIKTSPYEKEIAHIYSDDLK